MVDFFNTIRTEWSFAAAAQIAEAPEPRSDSTTLGGTAIAVDTSSLVKVDKCARLRNFPNTVNCCSVNASIWKTKPMLDETQKPENDNAKRNWKNYVSTVATLAAIVAACAAIYSLRQSDRLNSETAFLQHTQHRVSSCIAISQHHYAMWERDEAISWNEEIKLIIDGNEFDDDGQPILMTRNYERAGKAIGLARQLALCTSSDPEKTRTCIKSKIDQNLNWLVNDDNVGQGDQPRQGARNPIC